MKKWKILGTVVLLIVSIIALDALLFLRSDKSPNWEHPPLVWFRNARLIGNALSQYQLAHNGHLPSRLSDLVPSYIGYTNIQLFFWPPKPWVMTNKNPETISDEIDNGGAFAYLGERGVQENIILYECTNLWSKDGSAFVLTTNFAVQPLPITDIQARLSNLPH